MLSSDMDAPQVVYCGVAGKDHGLYVSPLAFEAYMSGFITIRSRPIRSTQRRICRYALRGFGVRATAYMIHQGIDGFICTMMALTRTHRLLQFIDTSSSGPDAIGHDFLNHYTRLTPFYNKILCNTSCMCTHGCTPTHDLRAQSPKWWNGVAYDMAEHLMHFDFKIERSTRQFVLKKDKCSLPSVEELLHLDPPLAPLLL